MKHRSTFNTNTAVHREFEDNPFGMAARAERECAPTYRLDEHIAEARATMGPERWAELSAEWETNDDA